MTRARPGSTVWLAVALLLLPAGALGQTGESAPAGNQPPRPLSDSGLRNLVALTRLLGYARFFHPSDETKDFDWESFAIGAVDRVEGAGSAEALVAALREEIAAIAPGIQIWVGERSAGPPEAAA